MSLFFKVCELAENVTVIAGAVGFVAYFCYRLFTLPEERNGGFSMEGMDKIDAKQQTEIEALKRRDVGHDRELLFYRVFGVVIVLVQVGLFVMLMQTLEKQGPYNCPHPDCVHHRAN